MTKELPEAVKERLQILVQQQNSAHLSLENYVNGVIDSMSLGEGQFKINLSTMTLEPAPDNGKQPEQAVEETEKVA